MVKIINKSQCCGCAACQSICPKKCIEMKNDNEGFAYPVVNEAECLNCGMCEKACPINRSEPLNNTKISAYSLISLDTKKRIKSSSGGAFSVLAEKVISNGGVVYGVAMSDDCRTAKHIKAESIADLSRLRGSKYLQTEPIKIYEDVKASLERKKLVLFSGTTCQVNGLYGYLNHNYENLITVDVICHGVPSQKLWKKYIEHEEKVYDAKVTSVNFRNKKKGWQNFGIEKNYSGKRIWASLRKDPYMHMFLNNYCLRPSCYNCKAKELKMSDISLGDFWGVDSFTPELNDGKGTSIVLVRTERGKKMFDSIKRDVKYREITYEYAVKYNPAEYTSAKRPNERDSFFNDMNSLNFSKLAENYCTPVKINVIKRANKALRYNLRILRNKFKKCLTIS